MCLMSPCNGRCCAPMVAGTNRRQRKPLLSPSTIGGPSRDTMTNPTFIRVYGRDDAKASCLVDPSSPLPAAPKVSIEPLPCE